MKKYKKENIMKKGKLKRLIEIGCIPTDSPEERLRKSIMTIMVIPYSLAGIIWGLYFMRNGFVISGVIPLAYAVVSLTTFFHFIYTKRYNIFRFFQVFLVLVLPFLLQLTLGGFSQSSGMLLWSCTAPFIALVFYDSNVAKKWFYALLFMLVLACFLDESARKHFFEDIDANTIVGVYGANFILISALIFGIQIYFLNGMKKIKIKLKEKEELLKAFSEIEKQKSLLSASKDRLELVMGSLEEVVWGRNLPDYQMQYVSNSVVKLYGFPMADWYENPNLWLDMIHPDDIQQVEKDNEPLFSLGVTKLEYRIITADKKIKWISSTTRIIKDTDGTPFLMMGIAKDITKLKEAELKVVAGEKRYRELFEKSSNANLILKNNLFIECNDAAIEMLGHKSKAALFNIQPFELSPEIQPDGQLSSEKSKEMNKIAYDTGSNRFEWSHLKSNGEVFPVEVSLTSLPSENPNDKTLHVVWRDITVQKNAQNQLNQLNDNLESKAAELQNSNSSLLLNMAEMEKLRTASESIAKELRQFIETANAPIFGIDSKGLVNEWNQTSERITGFTKEEVMGQDLVQTYITEDYQKQVKEVLDNALKGEETANYEFPLFTKEGKRVMVLLNSSTRRDVDGKVVGVLGVGQDITIINEHKESLEIKVLERTSKLKENEVKLKNSLEKEKELNQLKSSFISVASHQFRTPLAVIQSNTELLEMLNTSGVKQEPEKYAKVTNRITETISKMTYLMDDVLTLEKLTSGNVFYTPEDIDLVVFCEKLVKKLNFIQRDGRALDFVIDGEAYKLQLDANLLTHSLSNLISNAFNYSVGKGNPQLSIHFAPTEVILAIKDYGLGLTKEEQLHLFEPFFRADNVAEIKGTGLGLSIAKEYVEVNKGQISVKSILGEGSCFEITFKR